MVAAGTWGAAAPSRYLQARLWRCAAHRLPTPAQIALTVPHCSPGDQALAGHRQAGCRAIGSEAPHVAQPGAIIGLEDCLKKEAQVPANTYICFNVLSVC